MKLTEHFTLEELTISDIALRNGIDNTPSDAVIENLRILAAAMESVRTLLNEPTYVLSGYRCEAVEKILTAKGYRDWCALRGKLINEESWKEYFATKGHPKGFSCDFVSVPFGTPLDICKTIRASKLRYDQLIYEFKSWCHWSVDPLMRMQILTIDEKGTREGLT